MSSCSECTYLKLDSGDYNGQFFCEKRLIRIFATDPECYRFTRAYSRSNSESKSVEAYSTDHTTSNCYLTTIMCEILGYGDNNIYLEKIRKVRRDILQRDMRYKELLVEYDIIGPKIAESLNNDPVKSKISAYYFEKYIIPIKNFIDNKENMKAITYYIGMTKSLQRLYSLNNIVVDKRAIEEADLEKSGHGVYKKNLTYNK